METKDSGGIQKENYGGTGHKGGNMNTINILKKLIEIPSITADDSACQKVLKVARNILDSQNVRSKIINAAGKSILIWGELDLSNTAWLINSHLDVVPGVRTQFVPKITRDRLWGRGSADTKSSCSVILANSQNWDLKIREKHITFMLVIDEEVGGESTKKIIKEMKNLKGAIFLEPSCQKMIVQAKGIIQLKIVATGKSCHGSRPWEGENALEKLTNNLTAFRLQHPSPSSETRNTTFNFSSLNSGSAINQIPSEATLWCDIRWNPKDDPNNIVSTIKKVFFDCSIEIIKLESPINCPKSSSLRQTFIEALKSNSVNPISGFEHGSSDARHATALGIPALVFGPIGKNLHGDSEWVSMKSISKVEKVLGDWINII